MQLTEQPRPKRRVRRAGRTRAQTPEERATQSTSGRERGVALVMAMIALAILAVMLADMQQSTAAAFIVASAERDQLRAEYMARSGINLTRLLVAQEPMIRATVAPMYQMMIGRPPPQLPVWNFANMLLGPFCNYRGTQDRAGETGYDFSNAEGIGDTHATCDVVAFAENSRINLNDPLFFDGDRARVSVAMQYFSLMGGYQSPSPFDPLFEQLDADGQTSTRQDMVSALVDWWDYDTERTNFDQAPEPSPSEAQKTTSISALMTTTARRMRPSIRSKRSALCAVSVTTSGRPSLKRIASIPRTAWSRSTAQAP